MYLKRAQTHGNLTIFNSFLHLSFKLHRGALRATAKLRGTRVPDLGNTSVGNAINLLVSQYKSSISQEQEMLLLFF